MKDKSNKTSVMINYSVVYKLQFADDQIILGVENWTKRWQMALVDRFRLKKHNIAGNGGGNIELEEGQGTI